MYHNNAISEWILYYLRGIMKQQVRDKHDVMINKRKNLLQTNFHPEDFTGVKYFRLQLHLSLTLETPSNYIYKFLITGNV